MKKILIDGIFVMNMDVFYFLLSISDFILRVIFFFMLFEIFSFIVFCNFFLEDNCEEVEIYFIE